MRSYVLVLNILFISLAATMSLGNRENENELSTQVKLR
ncbi:unnamed protein product, partial [marine sediment metagenome]